MSKLASLLRRACISLFTPPQMDFLPVVQLIAGNGASFRYLLFRAEPAQARELVAAVRRQMQDIANSDSQWSLVGHARDPAISAHWRLCLEGSSGMALYERVAGAIPMNTPSAADCALLPEFGDFALIKPEMPVDLDAISSALELFEPLAPSCDISRGLEIIRNERVVELVEFHDEDLGVTIVCGDREASLNPILTFLTNWFGGRAYCLQDRKQDRQGQV